MASQGFVAVVGAGAGDKQDRGEWTSGARGGERACQGDVGFGVGKSNFFFHVGIGLGGILRAG